MHRVKPDACRHGLGQPTHSLYHSGKPAPERLHPTGPGALPPNQHYVEITIPAGVSYEVLQPAAHPGWDLSNGKVSRAFGCAWQASGRSLVLIVPSVVARVDHNILINPTHAEFPRIATGLNTPVYWDARLFP